MTKQLALALVGLMLANAAVVLANEAASEGKLESKEITGTVISKDPKQLVLEFDRSSTKAQEIVLPLGKEMKFQFMKDLSELKAGDTVRVRYQRWTKENEKGKPVVLKTEAQEITLVRRAPQDALVSKGEPE